MNDAALEAGVREESAADSLRAVSKVELHLHLDCSMSFEAVNHLDPSVSREEYLREFVGPARFSDLADFLKRPPRIVGLMQTEKGLRTAVFDLFEQLRADNVIYAEARFAPLLHTDGDLRAEEVVSIVDGAVSEAVEATGVESRLILCALRHFTAEESLETAKLVERFRSTRAAALDLAGDEAGFPLETHVGAFRYAAERGLPRIAHAGEASGAESVRQTLDLLQPSRISHGVRSVEDPQLLERLLGERVHLEVCPTCNVQIGLYPSYADHPVDRLYRAGLPVSVNTDTRTVTNVSLNEEYERMGEAFGWTEEDFLGCNLQALEAAFLPEEERRVLKQKLRGERLPR